MLTDREKETLYRIVNNDYNDGDIDSQTWSFAVCGDHASAGVLGSLVKKGLATSQKYDRDEIVYLTKAGKAEYRRLYPEGR